MSDLSSTAKSLKTRAKRQSFWILVRTRIQIFILPLAALSLQAGPSAASAFPPDKPQLHVGSEVSSTTLRRESAGVGAALCANPQGGTSDHPIEKYSARGTTRASFRESSADRAEKTGAEICSMKPGSETPSVWTEVLHLRKRCREVGMFSLGVIDTASMNVLATIARSPRPKCEESPDCQVNLLELSLDSCTWGRPRAIGWPSADEHGMAPSNSTFEESWRYVYFRSALWSAAGEPIVCLEAELPHGAAMLCCELSVRGAPRAR